MYNIRVYGLGARKAICLIYSGKNAIHVWNRARPNVTLYIIRVLAIWVFRDLVFQSIITRMRSPRVQPTTGRYCGSVYRTGISQYILLRPTNCSLLPHSVRVGVTTVQRCLLYDGRKSPDRRTMRYYIAAGRRQAVCTKAYITYIISYVRGKVYIIYNNVIIIYYGV